MGFSFSQFEGTHTRYENRITVTKSNTIGFPTKFYREQGVEKHKYVVLYYDENQKAIGIRFTNDETLKGRFSVGRSVRYGGSIVARSFFRAKNIDTNIYRGRYEWKTIPLSDLGLDGQGALYVIELKVRDDRANKKEGGSMTSE
jgi:hypothetical protein